VQRIAQAAQLAVCHDCNAGVLFHTPPSHVVSLGNRASPPSITAIPIGQNICLLHRVCCQDDDAVLLELLDQIPNMPLGQRIHSGRWLIHENDAWIPDATRTTPQSVDTTEACGI
jgi:hypothetical protein